MPRRWAIHCEEIVVGSFPTLAMRFMPALLAGFAQRYPGISVRLEEGDQQEIIAGLTSGRIELALSYNFAVPDEIIGEKLSELPPYILVSADHPLAGRVEVSLTELRAEPFILLDLPHSREYFFSLFAACGVEPQIAFRTRSSELIRGSSDMDKAFRFTMWCLEPLSAMTVAKSHYCRYPSSYLPPPSLSFAWRATAPGQQYRPSQTICKRPSRRAACSALATSVSNRVSDRCCSARPHCDQYV